MSVGIYMLQTWAIFGVQKCQLLRGVTAFLLAEKISKNVAKNGKRSSCQQQLFNRLLFNRFKTCQTHQRIDIPFKLANCLLEEL